MCVCVCVQAEDRRQMGVWGAVRLVVPFCKLLRRHQDLGEAWPGMSRWDWGNFVMDTVHRWNGSNCAESVTGFGRIFGGLRDRMEVLLLAIATLQPNTSRIPTHHHRPLHTLPVGGCTAKKIKIININTKGKKKQEPTTPARSMHTHCVVLLCQFVGLLRCVAPYPHPKPRKEGQEVIVEVVDWNALEEFLRSAAMVSAALHPHTHTHTLKLIITPGCTPHGAQAGSPGTWHMAHQAPMAHIHPHHLPPTHHKPTVCC